MQIFRFGMVGVLNTLIDFLVLNILLWSLGIDSGRTLVVCNGVAFFAASLNSYLCNKRWTFADKGRETVRQYLLFILFSVGGLIVNTLVLYLFTTVLPLGTGTSSLLQVNIAKVFATVASMAWNYLTYRRFVFERTPVSATWARPRV